MTVPDYAIKHAPLVYFHPKEAHFPAHVRDHINKCGLARSDFANVAWPDNLKGACEALSHGDLNSVFVYLTSPDDIKKDMYAHYLTCEENKPDNNNRSKAPAFIITVEKPELGPGYVDVFYFFFFAFNLGTKVAGQNFGNHVGDWEHVMIRYKDGNPEAVHISAHSDGHAYKWDCMEKNGDRLKIYSAVGSHAHYAKAGNHAYSPAGVVGPIDKTSDKGPVWDPVLNYCAASYNVHDKCFNIVPSDNCPALPGDETCLNAKQLEAILNFQGKWGNSFAELHQKKDKGVFDKLKGLKWAEGPTGVLFKKLDRLTMNQNNSTVLSTIN